MNNYFFETQAELVKNWEKQSRFMWMQDDENLFWTTDGYVANLVPNQFVLVDVEKLRKRSLPVEGKSLRSLIGNDSDYYRAEIIGSVFSKGDELAVLTNGKEKAYVPQKMLKKFKKKEFDFYVCGRKNLVRVTYNGILCGGIMPVNYQENETV